LFPVDDGTQYVWSDVVPLQRDARTTASVHWNFS